jgi:hypothetical protein
MVDAAIAVQNGLNWFAARKRRRKSLIHPCLVRKCWRCSFGVWIHESLDLVRSAGVGAGHCAGFSRGHAEQR